MKDSSQILDNQQVKEIFTREINKINRTLCEHERILRFRVVPDVWSPSTGELSASLKLKRKVIESKYSDLIDSIYMQNVR